MERWQAQENLSHLVNIEALLGKLCHTNAATVPQPARSQPVHHDPKGVVIPLELKWPRAVLSPLLKSRLESAPKIQKESASLEENLRGLSKSRDFEKLNAILEILTKDVLAARDRLMMLNPGRRKMVEHRLEFIARRIARSRGERLNRSLSLPEILRESYRDGNQPNTKLGHLAWRGFVSEVALYQILELFFLKALDVYGWRRFEPVDLGRMNFAIHTFLNQRAAGFSHDKHCWNFVRTNVYSWYVPSQSALAELSKCLQEMSFSWSDRELLEWMALLPTALKPTHFDFNAEERAGKLVLDLLESQLSTPLTANFQGRLVCKKFFLPALELGGFALGVLERLLTDLRRAAPNALDGGIADEASQLQRALWGCDSESFEVFWTEVVALLKVLRFARSNNDWSAPSEQNYPTANPVCLYRLPHAIHAVNNLGLELHNMDQLPLGGPEVSKLQQGSAAQIQQLETFDVALVNDHPDRAKSARWMKALSDQLPYWRTLVGNSTNLNWGELHLYLAMSKLKENGTCIYLSHRVLPESGDGDKLRKAILNLGTLECFVELHEDACRPYRYLYVFRRVSAKLERDQNKPRFGHLKSPSLGIDLGSLEIANSCQSEIAERGWDHLFVRGAAPLIRHLSHKFPKLFQIATIQSWHESNDGARSLFKGAHAQALEVTPEPSLAGTATPGLRFTPLTGKPDASGDRLLVFPHNPVDLAWIECLLNSPPAQFWIRHQLLGVANAAKTFKLQELRSCPIVDLSHAPNEAVHSALEWMGETKRDAQALREWACRADSPLIDRYSKFVALAKRFASLEKIVARYRPLFTSPTFEELRHDSINQFYPTSLLCHVSQSPDLRIQYADRNRSSVAPDSWTICDLHSVVQHVNGRPMSYLVIQTRQGPTIQILVPAAIREYLMGQLRSLRDHTWGEALAMLQIPRDIPLFAAQAAEITRVVSDTAGEMRIFSAVLDEMALDLFEIPQDVRQFLPH